MVEGSGQALATVELVGALAYAQLRAFQLAADAVRIAPDVRAADRIAGFAISEHAAYVLLRDHLDDLTDLSMSALDSQKPRVDSFFDNVPMDDWVSACTFFAIGLPMAADFARAVAPALETRTAEVVIGALAERAPFERYASQELVGALEERPDLQDHVRRLAAEVTGSAFTEFQGAVTSTDALLVLLEQLEEHGTEDVLRRTAIDLLEKHRRRMHAIGVDTPE